MGNGELRSNGKQRGVRSKIQNETNVEKMQKPWKQNQCIDNYAAHWKRKCIGWVSNINNNSNINNILIINN